MTSQTATADHLALDMVLPWHHDQSQQDRFQRLVKFIAAPLMIFLLVMPMLPDFAPEEEVKKKIVAKLALDPPEPVPEPETVPEPEPQQAKPKPSQAKPKEKSGSPKASDLNALSQQLSALRSSVNTTKLQKKNVFVSKSGKVQKSSRSLLGQKNAVSASSGIASSDITVNAQGGQLLGHQSDSVESSLMDVELPTEEQYHADPKKKSRRDMQSIRRTLERYKGAVYSLYTKALRKNPELNGRFIFEFVILPSGEIQKLKLVSSELKSPDLEKKMLQKIQTINFGQAESMPTAVQYTFTFVPS